jgi:hypothetical protein
MLYDGDWRLAWEGLVPRGRKACMEMSCNLDMGRHGQFGV